MTEPPTLLGQFSLDERLASSFVDVHAYRAHGPDGSRVVVEATAQDYDRAKQFFRTARILAALDHPYLRRVRAFGRDVGRQDAWLWLVKDAAPAATLEAAWHRDPPTRLRILDVLVAAGSALDELHRRGLTHALTPADVYIDDARVVLDVGIAFNTFRPPDITRLPYIFFPANAKGWERVASVAADGTPTGCDLQFIAPEHLTAERSGPASDIYSLGVIAYHALVGCDPFGVNPQSPGDGCYRKIREQFLPVPAGQVPDAALAVLKRCLAADSAKRWPSAAAFVAALEKSLAPSQEVIA